jgi:hypothetical protein
VNRRMAPRMRSQDSLAWFAMKARDIGPFAPFTGFVLPPNAVASRGGDHNETMTEQPIAA